MFVNEADRIMRGEAVASQLPGRDVGPADAYRHILLAAEATRQFGERVAMSRLVGHEREDTSGGDNGMDFWNNEIGIQIGNYVRATGGGWADVVRLARQVVGQSFAGESSYDQVEQDWLPVDADEGIWFAFERIASDLGTYEGREGSSERFEDFANLFNRRYRFRVRSHEQIYLENGALRVPHIALTSARHWEDNPVAEGERLSYVDAAFPDRGWMTGEGFLYEPGNGSMRYFESYYGPFHDGLDESSRYMDLTIPRAAPPPRDVADPAIAEQYQATIDAARAQELNDPGSRVVRRMQSDTFPRHNNHPDQLPAGVVQVTPDVAPGASGRPSQGSLSPDAPRPSGTRSRSQEPGVRCPGLERRVGSCPHHWPIDMRARSGTC
jgi:hypothetical protein